MIQHKMLPLVAQIGVSLEFASLQEMDSSLNKSHEQVLRRGDQWRTQEEVDLGLFTRDEVPEKNTPTPSAVLESEGATEGSASGNLVLCQRLECAQRSLGHG
jgi:hypothetical protein